MKAVFYALVPFFETGSSACSVDGKRGDTKGPLGTDQDDRCRLHDRALGLDAVECAVKSKGVEIGATSTGDRLMPAWQWARTVPPPSSARRIQSTAG